MFWCVVSLIFLLIVCILTRPTDSSKYCTTRKNIQRYYTTKHLIRYIYSIMLEANEPIKLTLILMKN